LPFFSTSVIVPTTGHQHEYVVVTLPTAVRLRNDEVYDVEVTFPEGDVTFDCFELKSPGK
jgi:hypothetical protein